MAIPTVQDLIEELQEYDGGLAVKLAARSAGGEKYLDVVISDDEIPEQLGGGRVVLLFAEVNTRSAALETAINDVVEKGRILVDAAENHWDDPHMEKAVADWQWAIGILERVTWQVNRLAEQVAR